MITKPKPETGHLARIKVAWQRPPMEVSCQKSTSIKTNKMFLKHFQKMKLQEACLKHSVQLISQTTIKLHCQLKLSSVKREFYPASGARRETTSYKQYDSPMK